MGEVLNLAPDIEHLSDQAFQQKPVRARTLKNAKSDLINLNVYAIDDRGVDK